MTNDQNPPMESTPPPGLEFPCEIDIKVFIVNKAAVKAAITTVIKQGIGADNLLQIRERPSGKGNYLGLSCLVYAADRASIDGVYTALSQHPDVKMLI